MSFEPNKVTNEHILQAVERIDKEQPILKRSTKYLVIINGKEYPPKEVMRYAHEAMNGEHIWKYSGGEATHKFLKQFGYQIQTKNDNGQDPLLSVIKRYKEHIQDTELSDELYKWRLVKKFFGRPDITADNFEEEVINIDYDNLLYYSSKDALRKIAKTRAEELRGAFKALFDDGTSLSERVVEFDNSTERIFAEISTNKNHSHQQEERALATYLTYHDPTNYTFFKDSFYQKFCKLLDIKPKEKGYKYEHYLELIQDFIEDYITPDEELISLKEKFLDDECYEDPNHLILAQDILFQMIDKHPKQPDENNLDEKTFRMIQPLNQILYGPPGTGKTYHTVNLALQIIENKTDEDLKQELRVDLKQRFNEYVKSGQVVFCTFHQSTGYEDFVEGIKPQEPDNEGDNVIYKIEDGLFKRICSTAHSPQKSQNFEEAFNSLLKEFENLEGEKIELKTPRGNKFWISLNKNNNLNLYTGNQNKQGSFTRDNLLKHVNGEDAFIGWEGYANGIASYLKDKHGFQINQKKKDEKYVFIIDEINRGNVSQIFGELITLIERDKRLGEKEELEVTLPYSKKKFGVPSNLYIIGTMNTADRSVEALDTALRRRFAFKEIEPNSGLLTNHNMLWHLWDLNWQLYWDDPKWQAHERTLKRILGAEIIDKDAYDALENIDSWEEGFERNVFEKSVQFKGGIEFDKLLHAINERIELLLDKDHKIGHAYFFSLIGSTDCEQELQNIFYNKIIPLLEEYFYGDYSKIGLILGKDFVKPKPGKDIQFANFKTEDMDVYKDKSLYEIIDFRQAGGDFTGAVKNIYAPASHQIQPADE
jgi:5-methylcytosine-specific restriction endonuclease McrBC GTP-binding regulatory subunit McrB